MSNDYLAEKDAYASFAKLLTQVDECKRLFERAGIDVPEPLKRLMGTANGNRRRRTRVSIPALDRDYRPIQAVEAQEEWLSIPAVEGTATSLVLAALRDKSTPVPVRRVGELVAEVNPRIALGSIHNIGTRLSAQGVIRRTEDGWALLRNEASPLLDHGYLWGPRNVFDKPDLAAHRREAILHILECFPGGLQIVQIVEQLKSTSWVLAPVSKDLLKADMEILENDRKVRRVGNSKKWEGAPKANENPRQ